MEPSRSHTDSHLDAYSLLSFIIFLFSLPVGCCTILQLNFELNFRSFLLHDFHGPTYSCFHRPGEAEIPPPSECWLEKTRDQSKGRNTISHLMGMEEDHGLFGERRRRIGHSARIRPHFQGPFFPFYLSSPFSWPYRILPLMRDPVIWLCLQTSLLAMSSATVTVLFLSSIGISVPPAPQYSSLLLSFFPLFLQQSYQCLKLHHLPMFRSHLCEKKPHSKGFCLDTISQLVILHSLSRLLDEWLSSPSGLSPSFMEFLECPSKRKYQTLLGAIFSRYSEILQILMHPTPKPRTTPRSLPRLLSRKGSP